MRAYVGVGCTRDRTGSGFPCKKLLVPAGYFFFSWVAMPAPIGSRRAPKTRRGRPDRFNSIKKPGGGLPDRNYMLWSLHPYIKRAPRGARAWLDGASAEAATMPNGSSSCTGAARAGAFFARKPLPKPFAARVAGCTILRVNGRGAGFETVPARTAFDRASSNTALTRDPSCRH